MGHLGDAKLLRTCGKTTGICVNLARATATSRVVGVSTRRRARAMRASFATPARVTATPRRVVARARIGAIDVDAIDRRVALARVASVLAASTPARALGADLEDALARKAARKAAVREAAAASAKTGRGEAAFADAERGVSEESRTPNAHSRQEEGLRKTLSDNA